MSDRKTLTPNLRFWLFVPVAGIVTWAIHELAHYGMGRALGYSMWMSMNRAGLAEGEYDPAYHGLLVTMAGPGVTYLQAGLAFWFGRSGRPAAAYPYLFFAFFTRLLAFGVSFANPNDEATASLLLGWPMWVLPVIAVAVLTFLFVRASRELVVGWKVNLGMYGIASVVTTAIVLGDPVVGRILG